IYKDHDVSANDKHQYQYLNHTRKSAIPTMYSSMATDDATFQFLRLSMEGLYRHGDDAEVKEGIAIDHEESDDGMQWTFNLRDDAEWSNGDPVTAHDFVYAWKRDVDPANGSVYGPYMMNSDVRD